jgi:alditol oxidase
MTQWSRLVCIGASSARGFVSRPPQTRDHARVRNWAGNYEYAARRLHRPRTLDELRRIVASAPRVHVIGERHSFTGIGDAEEVVSLAEMPADVTFGDGTVEVSAQMRYGDVAGALAPRGLALANLASLPHITVGGAVATATHGSGVRNGNLATAVAALELVTSAGEVIRAARGEPDFDGMVVNLGALGALTRLTLDVEPAYEIAQKVVEDVTWDELLGGLDTIMAAAYSVSVFTLWGERAGAIWVKRRLGDPEPDVPGRPAGGQRHPIPGEDPAACTPQLGVPGAWSARLPHFRLEFTPSHGEEIQSEFFVDRAQAAGAIRAVRELGPQLEPILQVSELRTVAADRLWLSPQHGRDTLAIHFTWRRDQPAVERALRSLEAALAPLGATPHWGKLFLAPPRPKLLPEFCQMANRLDPRQAFRNPWLAVTVGL